MPPLTEKMVGAPREPSDKSITQQQEQARQRLAYWLMVILAVEIAGLLVGFLIPAVRCDVIPVDSMKELALIVFGPTVALVGSALGFYFGSPKRNR